MNIPKNDEYYIECYIRSKAIPSKWGEQKIISNLYFAGEVIDIDAETGGYNLQMAFSTGYLAGSDF